MHNDTIRLLSVDWDFFFRTVEMGQGERGEWGFYDWGHHESWPPALQQFLWMTRASAFLNAGRPLPRTTGAEAGFWDRFSFAPNARLWVADSHSQAAARGVLTGVTEVWNFDAHHDCGYETPLSSIMQAGSVDCANWMAAYHLAGADLHVVYPSWRVGAAEVTMETTVPVVRAIDDGLPVDRTFNRIFVCRSSSWTPPWIDIDFDAFLAACPVPPARRKMFGELPKRKWEEHDAQAYTKFVNDALKNSAADNTPEEEP